METKPDHSCRSHTVAFSRAEQVHIIMPGDCNQSFRLFGGRLMEWIDVVAAVVARRHCGCEVTTAAIDRLDFIAPAMLNDILVLQGRLVYVGHTSMLVCVDTYVEEPLCGKPDRTHVNSAFLTMVALDGNRRSTGVPRLEVRTEQEKTDYQLGKARHEAARSLKGEAPSSAEDASAPRS